MQRLEVSGAVRLIYRSLGVKGLNKKYIYSYLKCILYDKLLKPRQSFRITLYILSLNLRYGMNIRSAVQNLAINSSSDNLMPNCTNFARRRLYIFSV